MEKEQEHANVRQEKVKPFRSLNLADDFMFDAVTDHLECCQIILELSLGIRIRKIRWKENQKVVHNLPGKRGIRLDFYDCYTFTNQCKEIAGLELGDESTKIILNTKGTDAAGVEPALVDFLHYVPDSDKGKILEQADSRLKRLYEVIESIRKNAEMEAAYMKAETREREIIADAKAEGMKIGREEGIKEGMKEGRREGIKKSIANLMKNLKLTEEQAMEALEISKDERTEYAGSDYK